IRLLSRYLPARPPFPTRRSSDLAGTARCGTSVRTAADPGRPHGCSPRRVRAPPRRPRPSRRPPACCEHIRAALPSARPPGSPGVHSSRAAVGGRPVSDMLPVTLPPVGAPSAGPRLPGGPMSETTAAAHDEQVTIYTAYEIDFMLGLRDTENGRITREQVGLRSAPESAEEFVTA